MTLTVTITMLLVWSHYPRLGDEGGYPVGVAAPASAKGQKAVLLKVADGYTRTQACHCHCSPPPPPPIPLCPSSHYWRALRLRLRLPACTQGRAFDTRVAIGVSKSLGD